MLLDDLLNIMQTSGFIGSLKRFGFQLSHKFSDIVDKHGYRDRHIIGFESAECKIVCYYEPGGIAILMGTHDDDFDNLKSPGWISVSDLIAFINNQPINLDIPESKAYQEQISDTLSSLIADFEPLRDQILPIFQKSESTAHWKSKVKRYVHEEIQRKYAK